MQAIFQNFGIYLHVPFCAQNCEYCRFYKRIPTHADMSEYVKTVKDEISLRERLSGGALPKPETIFWGGGTPTALSELHLAELAEFFSDKFSGFSEWTVEVAPTSASLGKLKILKDFGVNRISMGVQSFNEHTLNALGRKHTLKATEAAIERIAQLGFANFSIDLIFGEQSQTEDEWIADLRRAAAQPVNHISAYCLEFESATSCCGGIISEGELEKRTREGDFLEIAMTLLPELGFKQYEISNYAKAPQARCLHNLSTWNMARWLGIGAAAASQWEGKRFRNSRDFQKWIDGIKNKNPAVEDIVNLDEEEMFSSALIFGLRLCDGVNFNLLKERFPSANFQKYLPTLDFLRQQNLIEISADSVVKLTREGRLVADSVAVELL